MTDWKALCAELTHEVEQYADDRGDLMPECADRARAALAAEPVAERPTDTQLIEEAIAVGLAFQPQDEVSEVFLPFDAEEPLDELLVNFARAVLARWGHKPAPAAEGEVGVLLRELRDAAFDLNGSDPAKLMLTRAAELLAQRHPAPVPAGMIPVEYWDMDSGARIVTEPSEEGPGGCWVVLNSRYVNPFTEFPTAKAAWDALQQAHALPLPAGEAK